MAESTDAYGDWRSLELAIKDAAKNAAAQAGPGVSAASISAQIKQARFDRFLSRVFADGKESEWLLKGGMSMLARVPRSRTTKNIDLATIARRTGGRPGSMSGSDSRQHRGAPSAAEGVAPGTLRSVAPLRGRIGLPVQQERQTTWKVAFKRYNPSMRSKDALRALAEITAYQWGMVTSAQASMFGVPRLDLSRLAADGLLERVTHGVYKTPGTPSGDLDPLRAAWLSTDPKRLAHERRPTDSDAVVVAGASAARIHEIGDVWDERFDFISPVRRQSQREVIRYRKRLIDPRDVTAVEGLPVLSVEATIADLVQVVGDLSLVTDALRDASRKDDLDAARLAELLDPAVLARLTELSGLEQAVAHG